jgi:hypothetical protein
MRPPQWFRARQYRLAVFLGTMGLLGGALTWLGWQLIEQDRQLERQRTQERLEHAADQVSGALEASLRGFNLWLPLGRDALSAAPPAGLTLLVKNDGGVRVHPAGGLLYLPPDTTGGKTPDAVFAPGNYFSGRQKPSGAPVNWDGPRTFSLVSLLRSLPSRWNRCGSGSYSLAYF